jgi:D-alanyl-D-alanine-carboxypeptidase/D-alanyl-D-alanine-endopeptidase
MPASTAERLKAIFLHAHAPGMVAAVVDGERSYFAGFGRARTDSLAPPDERSLLRINSISKAMAGEILAGLIAEHRIELDAPLQRFAPPGRVVPRFLRARPINLRDIVIHTSGLPRDLPSALEQISRDERWDWLERIRPLRAPGRVAQYSNAAYMFLGDAMVRASATNFATLLTTRIAAPLGLKDTTLAPTPEQCGRLMTNGRDDHTCAPTRETAASAGVYSTAADMARWMRHELDHPPAPMVRRRELQRLIGMDMAGRTEAIGMGWLHMRLGNTAVIQKTGGGGGFMNYVVLAPSRRQGIFVTVSRTDIEMLRRVTRETNALLSELGDDR